MKASLISALFLLATASLAIAAPVESENANNPGLHLAKGHEKKTHTNNGLALGHKKSHNHHYHHHNQGKKHTTQTTSTTPQKRGNKSGSRHDLSKLGNEMWDATDNIIHNGVDEDVALSQRLFSGDRPNAARLVPPLSWKILCSAK
ncbi:hypothetical protein G9A89_019230 [Geosiphon pyriformis]|nr:hypothetical protein G9A89_019230 [Geosiphon pyriformis]